MTIEAENQRTVILNRVSSLRQEDGFSLDAQNELNLEYCRRKNLLIVKTFTFAESAGAKKQRREFELVLNFILENQVQHLVCEKTDRLLRNFYDYIKVEQLINDNELHVHFPKEGTIIPRQSNSHEKQVFGFKVLIAKGFLDNLSEETKKGLRKKLESGGYPMRAPFGYRNDRNLKRLIIHGREAETMKAMFLRYLETDASVDDLADWLNMDAISPPRGNIWHGQVVHKMLKNPVFYGDVRWKGKVYKGGHDGIVSYKVWAQVQKKLKKRGGPRKKRMYALGGLMYYQSGRLLTGEMQKGRVYYGARIQPTGKKGGKVYIREDEAFSQLDDQMLKLRWSQTFKRIVIQLATNILTEEKQSVDRNTQSLQQQIGLHDQKEAKLLDLYLEGELRREVYLAKKSAMEKRKSGMLKQLGLIQGDQTILMAKVNDLADKFTKTIAWYKRANDKEKARIIGEFCESIEMNEEKKLSLTFRSPYREFLDKEILQVCGSDDTVRIRPLLRPLGESNSRCENENLES